MVVTVVVIVVAIYAVAYLVPGAAGLLGRYGIALPLGPSTEASSTETAGNPNAGAPNPGGNPGCQRGRGRETAVVVTAAVTSAVINDKLMAIGEGSAARSVTLTSAAGGTLTELKVKPGDKVEAGTVIAELDADSEQIAFDRARLASEDAASALARSTELANTNSISNVQLNAAQLAADNAELEMRNAQLALKSRSIVTPIAGTVGLLQVTPGNLVNAQTVVTTIEDSSEILINFWVPERYASSVAVGMPVAATCGRAARAELRRRDQRRRQPHRSRRAARCRSRRVIPNDDGRIRAGMSFQITMSFPGETFASVDPLSIQWSADGAYVWKYVEGKVEQAFVQIVERNSGGVLVTGDVAVGDQVVTQGVLQLQAGAEVRLLDEGGAPTGRQRGDQPGQGQQRLAGPAAAGDAAVSIESQNARGGQIAGLFVRRPVLAIVVNALIIVAGLAAFFGVEVRELPSVEQPVLSISTQFPGAAAETVDREITSEVEGAVARVQGVVGDLVARRATARRA